MEDVLLKKQNTNRNLFTLIIIFASLFLCLFSGFQLFGKNVDYKGYIQIFGEIRNRNSTEPLFSFARMINDFVFNSSVSSIFLLFSLFSIMVKIRQIYYFTENDLCFMMALFFYCITFFFLHEYTQIRAATAIAIYWTALNDYVNNRRKKYFFKATIAFLCHYSSITMFVFPIFCKVFNTKLKIFFVVMMGVFFAFICSSRFSSDIENAVYFLSKVTGINKVGDSLDFIQPTNLKYTFLLLYFLISLKVINPSDKKNFILLQSFAMGLCYFYYLNPVHLPVISVRFAEYHNTVVTILFANVASKIHFSKTVCFSACVLFFLFYSKTVLNQVGIL